MTTQMYLSHGELSAISPAEVPQRRALLLGASGASLDRLAGYLESLDYQLHPLVASGERPRLRQAAKEGSILLIDLGAWGEQSLLWIERARSFQRYLPILLIAPTEGDPVLLSRCLDAGADDYVSAPVGKLELKARIQNLDRLSSLENDLKTRCKQTQKELESARELQMSLLPRSPLVGPGITFCWSYQPHGLVGGDMLDVFALADDVYGLYVADVCGHGAAAAMMSIWLRHTLRPPTRRGPDLATTTHEAIHSMLFRPCYTAAFLESKLADEAHERYLTMLYAVVDAKSRRLVFSRCGHPHPTYLPPGQPARLLQGGGGTAIGLGLGLPFQEQVLPMEPGGRIFFYSDGLLEASSPRDELFGQDRCLQILEATRHLSLQEQIDALQHALLRFQQRREFDDDLTILGVEMS